MLKHKFPILPFALLCIVLTLSGALYYFSSNKILDLSLKTMPKAEVLTALVADIEKRWVHGDIEDLHSQSMLTCGKGFMVDPLVNHNYLHCNRHYMECFLSGKLKAKPIFNFKHNDKLISFKPIKQDNEKFTQTIVRSEWKGDSVPKRSVGISLQSDDIEFGRIHLLLNQNCFEQKLPQGVYQYGKSTITKSEEDLQYKFDTFGRSIMIDTFLVSKRDIVEWSSFSSFPSKLKVDLNSLNWAQVALNLNTEQKKEYCAFVGKKLLLAHLFDAATFVPLKRDKSNSTIFKSHFAWSDSFSEKSPFENEKINLRKKCTYIFSSECKRKFFYDLYSRSNTSWIGLSNVHGGPVEEFYNPIEPEKKYKSSHWNKDGISSLHFLGNRLTEYELEESGSPLKSGFRCYYEEENEI